MAEREAVVGNRLMLVGAVMYLLEWVAIIPAGDTGPSDLGKTSLESITRLYTGNARGAGFIVGWCALVLLGRVLIIIGARRALAGTRHEALVDWAVIAMAISVGVELVSVIGAAALSRAVHVGAVDAGALRALDALSAFAFMAILPALGLAVGLTSWVMLSSRRFPVWIGWLGVVAGVMLAAAGILSGASGGQEGTALSLGHGLAIGVPLFWIWMLAGGVFLWRRSGASAGVVAPAT